MPTIPQVTNQVVSQCEEISCCREPSPSPWMKTVDLVCRVALGVFGAMVAPFHFAVSFTIGTFLGAGYAVTRMLQNRPVLEPGEGKPICAQGYMNFLSGMRYPAVINTLATASFIAAHLRHDPEFYVPFSGLFIGLWIGRDVVSGSCTLASRAFSYFHPATPPPPPPKRSCCCAREAQPAIA